MMRFFKRGTFRRLGLGLAALLCVQLSVDPAGAEERELTAETKELVDAVLLVDASGSMRRTDPNRLRDEGAELFMRFLNPGDRLAIVEFSDQAKVIRPLSDFKEEDSAKVAGDLAKIADDGQYSDILTGLKMAHSILQEAGRPLEANQVIILLSDGKMEPDPAVGSPEERIKEMTESELPEYRDTAVKVYTLYFSEEADRDLLSQISASTDAVNWFAPNADKIHEAYADMFLAIKKPQVVPIQGKAFTIDPDIDEATFYMNREGEEEILLLSPDGRKIGPDTTDKNVKWFKGTRFDVVTVIAPREGAWRVSGLPSSESFATVLTNLKLVTDWPPLGTSGEPALLQARLYEGARPLDLKELTGVTQISFFITPTDRIAEPIMRETLVDDGKHGDKIAGDGIYSYEIKVDQPGEYRLTIGAKSETFQRNQQIPFRVRPRRISLSVVTETAKAEANFEGQEGAPAVPESTESFRVDLSAEASALRTIEVKLFARTADKKLYRLPLKRLPGTPYKFQAAVSALPAEGEYTIYATLTGMGKKDKRISDESSHLDYKRTIKSAGEEGPEAIEIVEKGPPQPSKFPFYMNLLMVALTNALLCLIFLRDLSKVQKRAAVAMPTFTPIKAVSDAIEELKIKTNKADVDINDPIFAPQAEPTKGGAAEIEGETQSAEGEVEQTSKPNGEETSGDGQEGGGEGA